MTTPDTRFFYTTPQHPVTDRLPSDAQRLLSLLYWFRNGKTGQLNPTVGRIAEHTGWSERKVSRVMGKLRECAIITSKRTKGGNKYEIACSARWKEPARKSIWLPRPRLKQREAAGQERLDLRPPEPPPTPPETCSILPVPTVECYPSLLPESTRAKPHISHVTDYKQTQLQEQSGGERETRTIQMNKNTPHTPLMARDSCASDDARIRPSSSSPSIAATNTSRPGDWFDQWWMIYWRRVSKKAAEKAFRTHVRTAERFAEVMAATKAQSPSMMEREPEKRPHGASWLNGERWNDEICIPAARKPPERQDRSFVASVTRVIGRRLARGQKPW